jgi:hypothetical protein
MTGRVHPRCDRCQASSQLKGTNSAYERARTCTNEYWRALADSEVINRNFLADPTNGASGSSVDTRAAPGAMPHEVRGDPNSTETCCEEFLYPVKEPGRKRSTEPSGTDPPIRSVADPGPAPAFSLRRPRSSPTEIRHRRWRVGIAEARTVGFSQSIFVADRPASTEPWSCVKHLCSRRPR